MRFSAKKGKRFKKTMFHGVGNRSGYCYVDRLNKWVTREEYSEKYRSYGCGSHAPIFTLKAFCRHMKKWSKYLPAGVEFFLASRYNHCDVFMKTRKSNGKRKNRI